MKKIWLFFIATAMLCGCATDDDPSIAAANVISDGSLNQLEELVLLLQIKTSDSTYLVTSSIDSVSIYLNSFHWSITQSELLDTSKVNKYPDGNKSVTTKETNYLLLSRQNVIEEPDFNLASEFAKYLNQLYELRKGEYACLIESFQVTFDDGSTQTYYPYVYKTFKLEEDMVTIYVGEIIIDLNEL